MIPVSVGPIRPGELSAAVGVLARGMRDNPMHVAAFGDDPERRVLMLERMFEALFRTMDNAPLVARVGYLETDKAVNVAFYALSGFETVARAQVLGVENWFMRRQPRLPPAA